MRNGQADFLLRGSVAPSSDAGGGSPDMRSQIRHGDMHIGPKLAQWILSNCFYHGQSKRLKTGRIAILRHVARLRRGRWLDGSQITLCRLPGGRLVLVNGYHRMSAIIEYGDAAKFNVQIIDSADENSVESTYSLFDRAKDARSRSVEQQGNALHFVEHLGVSRAMTKSIGNAAILIQNGYRPIKMGDREKLVEFDAMEDVLALALSWKEEAQALDRAFSLSRGVLKRKLLTASILAVALTTVKHQPGRAKEFWSAVARNDGLRKNSPEHTLVEWLMTYRMEPNTSDGFIAASLAWNAFFTWRPLGVLRVGSTNGVYITGTPVDNRV